jgi:hypothetical protein
MQNRHSLLLLALAFFSTSVFGQTTYIPLWAKESWLLDRLEIKAQSDNNLNLSTVKPFMRKVYVEVADSINQSQIAIKNLKLSGVDQYNLVRFLRNNKEYADALIDSNRIVAGHSVPNNLRNRPNMLEVNQQNFFLVVNPAISIQQTLESEFDEAVYFRAFGASVRGLINKKIGFDLQVTANSEAGPLQFRRFVDSNNSVPGAVKFNANNDSTKFSYIDFRGSVNWNVTKYINMQFGRDQHLIGNGYRSLYLSNFAGPYTFLKFNTRIWKLNYTNLYTQFSATPSADLNKNLMKKYSSTHHLSVNVTKWLTVGGFESVVFGRDNGYDFSYLLPVIFLRSIEQQNGSPDNANLGFDVKANILKKLQVYGVLMLDEFKKDELVGESRYWWGNKQAYQLGAKYVDAFGISNLDLQAEFNQVRPFMYQFRDTTGAYTQALQPLAHPMGGNVREVLGVVRYQPIPRLYLHGRINWWKQGLDSAGYNFGSNPNEIYNSVNGGGTRPREDNFPMFSGMPVTGLNASFTASYEMAENMFLDFNGGFRSYAETAKPKVNTTTLTLGFRWNMFRKDYDY